ncbi:DUF4438 domain-containing protein [Actinokineospora auranticolor]|uniref:Uncharacterized protein DUF4438 n=1 Tax=Actinokineospora auranticolor TaxID=155976 RepID=A0A2S6GLF3_9PSEU|nr:DUF4438 domain-containing protein [Actinokineospora auranticolor]PPK66062.1 uncharacterized protein DUF4438 [Actinokineospora auranticolor]
MIPRSNADRLLTQVLVGEVCPPLGDRFGYRVDAEGRPFLLPGMGGVTLGVRVGDPATGHAADHLEPGLSVWHPDPAANHALQYLTCVGNEVTVLVEGRPRGRVLGQHAYVLVDLDDAAAVAPGDRVAIRARGQGLRLLDHPEVGVRNLDPDLLPRLPVETAPDGRLRVRVAARVPSSAVGAGAGMVSEFANTDLMGRVDLRIGDLVVLLDQDHRFGRGHRAGYVAIGAISTGDCRLFGHGPGPSTLLTGPAAAFDLVDDPTANLGAAW